jgi:hypothetical protein
VQPVPVHGVSSNVGVGGDLPGKVWRAVMVVVVTVRPCMMEAVSGFAVATGEHRRSIDRRWGMAKASLARQEDVMMTMADFGTDDGRDKHHVGPCQTRVSSQSRVCIG